MRQRWGNAGGCPVVYVSDQEDIESKLTIRDGGLIGLTAQSGEYVTISEESHINTYSRRRSRSAILGGFDNYKDKRQVRIGGGFRLQIDNISPQGNGLSFFVSGIFSFDDRGSRVLALESYQDQIVPRFSDSYRLIYVDHKLLLLNGEDSPVGDVIRTESAQKTCLMVVQNLFDNNGIAVTRLLRLLFSVSPSLGLHQLEGMYSVLGDEVCPEVIDFDGVDSLDSARSVGNEELLPELGPVERLVCAQLTAKEFLYANPIALRKIINTKTA